MEHTSRRIIKRYPLLEPLDDLSEIVWRKPNGRTMRRIGVTDVPGDQSALLTNEMTGLPISVLDELDLEDSLIVSNITWDIIRKKSEAARARAQELEIPIEIQVLEPQPRTAEEIEDASPEEVENLTTSADDLEESVKQPPESATSI